jgi:deoxyribodipyrimidine photo-lyase
LNDQNECLEWISGEENKVMRTAIWWIRRDLRLSDNQALAAAMSQAEVVIPVFILDPTLLTSPRASQNRNGFLFDGLRSLDNDLHQRGSSLIVRKGESLEVLHLLCRETGAGSIFAQEDVSPYSRHRDGRVSSELPLSLTLGVTVHPPAMVVKSDGTPYTVFTAFSRKWHSLSYTGRPISPPERLSSPPKLTSLDVPDSPKSTPLSIFKAGESDALKRLEAFVDSDIYHYAESRDRMDQDSTSGLSPYLKFGMLSARQAVWAAQEAGARAQETASRKGVETWLNELIWREFYATILNNFPNVLRTAFRPALREIRWHEDPAGFTAWTEGRTGYPVVDAAMRQLNAIGWMHNRARMIAASFLVKDLLIDWRLGERYFMQHLLDGDPAANNGGWQWTAGTGTDAAPYFRIFNPVLQGKKFDPYGAFIRRWVPELSRVPDAFIHTPWAMPDSVQSQTGCRIGKHYPAPIVDHATARQYALDAYRRGYNGR